MWLSRFLVALIVVAFFTQAESQQPAVLADETRSYEISSTAPGSAMAGVWYPMPGSRRISAASCKCEEP